MVVHCIEVVGGGRGGWMMMDQMDQMD